MAAFQESNDNLTDLVFEDDVEFLKVNDDHVFRHELSSDGEYRTENDEEEEPNHDLEESLTESNMSPIKEAANTQASTGLTPIVKEVQIAKPKRGRPKGTGKTEEENLERHTIRTVVQSLGNGRIYREGIKMSDWNEVEIRDFHQSSLFKEAVTSTDGSKSLTMLKSKIRKILTGHRGYLHSVSEAKKELIMEDPKSIVQQMPPDFNMKPGSHVWCVHRTFSKGQRLAEAVILEDVKDENLYKLCLLKHVSRKHTLVLPKNNYQDLPGITKKEKLALLENGDIFYVSKTNTSPLKLNNRPSKKKQLHNDTTTDNNKERPKIKLLSKKIEMEEQENQKRKDKIKAKKAAAKNENARQPQTKRVKSSDGEKADKEKEKEETRKTTAEKRPKAKYDPNILIPKFMEATKEPEKDLSSTPKLPTTLPSKPSTTTSTITKQKPGYTYTYQPPVNIYQELVVPEGATRKRKAKKLESD